MINLLELQLKAPQKPIKSAWKQLLQKCTNCESLHAAVTSHQ